MSFIDNRTFDSPEKTDTPVDFVGLIRKTGLAAVPDALSCFGDTEPHDEALQLTLLETAVALVAAFAADGVSADAYRALARIVPQHAQLACDLMMLSFFPDGNEDLAALDDAALLAAAGLLVAAGRHADALAVLAEAIAARTAPAFRYAAFVARLRSLGHDEPGSLWIEQVGGASSVEGARAAVAAKELDVAAHRVLVRRMTEAGSIEEAAAALSTALALPVGTSDRLALGEELAVLTATAIAQGRGPMLLAPRIRLALKANPMIAMRALALLGEPGHAFAAAAGQNAVAAAAHFLHGFANPVDLAVRSPYPLRHGKPHVETVWLEITNFCNQKCTFCPDMHREDSRQWLPLAEVKRLIDELADTVSVGSMQLNAYGEPLLHPHIQEILSYINEKKLPWPTFFTSHGLTLVPKKLAQLSNNYPAGIALSLHNDSQESYAATRSAKLGDYDTLVSRVADLLRQMVTEGAACHMRLYQMVANGNEDQRVDPTVRGAFPNSPERMMAHVRKWEAIAAEIAATAPPAVRARPLVNSPEAIARAFFAADHGDGNHLPILEWADGNGNTQRAFMSPRPVGSYANLLLEYHPNWAVERKVVNANTCGFVGNPSLAIFATRKLGICCLDMNSTGTFGSLDDFPSLAAALTSPEAARMFAQVANGVATSRGCQICLGEGRQLCSN